MNVNPSDISIAILAGGAASRMGGGQKALLPLNGKTLLNRYINLVSHLSDDIMIIANPPHDVFSNTLKIYPDIIPGRGPLSGIHSALHHSIYPRTLIMACDMPLISKQLIDYLISQASPDSRKVLIPVHPQGYEPLISIWPVILLPALNAWFKAGKSNKILHFLELNNAIELIDVSPFESQFANLNSPEDLQKIVKPIKDDSKFEP